MALDDVLENGNSVSGIAPHGRRKFLGGLAALGLLGTVGTAQAERSRPGDPTGGNDNPNGPQFRSLYAERADVESAGVGPFGVVTNNAARGAVYEAQNPQAVYVDAEDTTFLVYRGDDADPFATHYDHDSHTWGKHVRIGTNPLDNGDNHGVPSLAIDDDGTLHVFYGAHSSPFQYARSADPYDSSSWVDEGELTSVPGGTYPSPLVYDDDLYVLYRTGKGGHSSNASYLGHAFATIIRSRDGGDTWADLGPIIDTTGHPDDSDAYVNDFDVGPNGLHISWFISTGDGHNDLRQDAYHAFYDPSDGRLHSLDGATLGETITWADHGACEVYDGDYTNKVKHAFDDDTVYVSFETYNPEREAVEFKLATHDGSWSIQNIGDAVTETLANGGMIRVNDDGNVEAHLITNDDVSIDDPTRGTRSGNYDVYTLTDGTWMKERMIPADPVSDFAMGRVTIPRNAPDKLRAVAVEASPDATSYDLGLWAIGAVQHTVASASVTSQSGGSDVPVVDRKRRFQSKPDGLFDLITWGKSWGLRYGGRDEDRKFLLSGHPDWVDQIHITIGGTGSSELVVRQDGTIEAPRGGFVPPTKDVSSGGYRGKRDHEMVFNETARNSNPEGPWKWDAANADWILVRDESVTVSPAN